jgi:hypothetical protein
MIIPVCDSGVIWSLDNLEKWPDRAKASLDHYETWDNLRRTLSVLEEVPLRWADINWAYSRGLIDWTVVSAKADLLSRTEPPDSPVLELQKLPDNRACPVDQILQTLAQRDSISEEDSKKKWAYITLPLMYERRSNLLKPFQSLESINYDFGYPDYFYTFINPTEEGWNPAEHSYDECIVHTLCNLRAWLDSVAPEFSHGKPI